MQRDCLLRSSSSCRCQGWMVCCQGASWHLHATSHSSWQRSLHDAIAMQNACAVAEHATATFSKLITECPCLIPQHGQQHGLSACAWLAVCTHHLPKVSQGAEYPKPVCIEICVDSKGCTFLQTLSTNGAAVTGNSLLNALSSSTAVHRILKHLT